MYTSRTGLILGFHGTDESIVTSVLNGEKDLEPSNNSYDWLGNGIYFWDNSPSRALAWAEELSKRKNSKITKRDLGEKGLGERGTTWGMKKENR